MFITSSFSNSAFLHLRAVFNQKCFSLLTSIKETVKRFFSAVVLDLLLSDLFPWLQH